MNCPICGGGLEKLISLPRFPITEKYETWAETFEEGRGFVDQAFLYCESCSHGRLETVVPDLYGSDYRTSTSKSDGARQAVSRFAYFIEDHCTPHPLQIDIGGNEGEMTKYFDNVVLVDPHATSGIRSTIEEADLSVFRNERKIIMSSHTIEHLVDPEVMIRKCAEIMGPDDYLCLQFPSLELMVADARIDQINHQHIHYFSTLSIDKMLSKHGLISHTTNYDSAHWGALMLIARKCPNVVVGAFRVSAEQIRQAQERFIFDITSTHIPEGSAALGAALMLPVLAYWIPELENVSFIADDDKSKEGLRYINFNKRITSDYSLAGKDVVITAVGTREAYRKLTKKAIDAGARNIILPLHTL